MQNYCKYCGHRLMSAGAASDTADTPPARDVNFLLKRGFKESKETPAYIIYQKKNMRRENTYRQSFSSILVAWAKPGYGKSAKGKGRKSGVWIVKNQLVKTSDASLKTALSTYNNLMQSYVV